MRSKLLALLIALLPLQLCWAAVAPYVHDDARGAAHVAGLHGVGILQPQESLFDVGLAHKTVLDPSQQSDASGADLDCDVCHSHNSAYLQPSIMATIAAVHESFGAIAFALKPPPAPLRPERPQWFALA
ncbi:hypothetical protein [Acidovorax sp. LjRoot194]|uniref:hypothetical protein n=1 Tax=Acidovorax sp. LjRoot194 TaxID=3342280 RepID=UPI003ECF07DD